MNNKCLLILLILAFTAKVDAGLHNGNNNGISSESTWLKKQPRAKVVTKAGQMHQTNMMAAGEKKYMMHMPKKMQKAVVMHPADTMAAGEKEKMQPAGMTSAEQQEQMLTMEQRHEFMPMEQRKKMARQCIARDIKNEVFTALNNLVENSNGNLTHGKPETKGTRLAMYIDPETNQQFAINYTPSKPVKMIETEQGRHVEEYKLKLYGLLHSLADKYAHCGLQFKSIVGTAKAPQNWLAWYQTNPGLMGAPKMFLVLENVQPTIDQIEATEKTGKMSMETME